MSCSEKPVNCSFKTAADGRASVNIQINFIKFHFCNTVVSAQEQSIFETVTTFQNKQP